MLLSLLRKHMHRDGVAQSDTRKLRLSDMEKVVTLQGGRSIFSGIADFDRLTVGRWNSALPWSFDNLVILTYAEHREHNRRCLADYHAGYVDHVEAHLLARDTGGVGHEPAMIHEGGHETTDLGSEHDTGLDSGGADDQSDDVTVDKAGSDTTKEEAPYPPKSAHTRGLTTDVVWWYMSKFGVMHPLLHKMSDAIRPDSVPRVTAMK